MNHWIIHVRGIMWLWCRLSLPGALLLGYVIGVRWLIAGVSLPVLMAAGYALGWMAVRRLWLIPLHWLRRCDGALLVLSSQIAVVIVTDGFSVRPVWHLAVMGLVLSGVIWYANWMHEAPDRRPGEGAVPDAPAFESPLKIAGPVTAGYRSYDRSHTGVDVGVPVGTPLYAPSLGRVIHAAPSGAWGLCIQLDHGNGWATFLAHLDRIVVERGAVVSSGDLLGLSGNSGISTGPHVHLELRYQGRPVAPDCLIPR